MGALDPERIQGGADERGVTLDGLREVVGLVGLAEAGRVPRDGPHAGDGQQRLPVGARARVAVDEDDRLAIVGRTR